MFEGATTALITPFLENGEVDFDGFRSNVEKQIASGIHGLLVLGTTGETPTLNADEQERLIRITVETADHRVPVMVGTGTNDTAATVRKTSRAAELGADAVLVVTPYYNKPTSEGLFRHFQAAAGSADIPVFVYNIQGRSGRNIETPLLKRIAGIKGIAGVKEASGNIGQISDVIEQLGRSDSFTVLSGDDGMTLPLMALGGRGVISVISNGIPNQVSRFTSAALKGDWDLARKMHFDVIMPVTRAAFIETNPVPIKYICAKLGMASGTYRLPMCPLEEDNRRRVDQMLAALGLAGKG
ncbi:MAG: 4-hydroxy-tetrahydrodipicolinate synthase [Candidatus Wallbacteria bacterium]|nr:4-hydroxy-tetrahydrodipicolinate synthase [Candidatus Wallbacteria bacterium]